MTRVDFYILPAGGDGVVATACKLCDKASSQNQRVYVHVPDAAQADELDGALWSLRQGSFIAHERNSGRLPEEPLPAVLFGETEPPSSYAQNLINLAPDVPPFFSRFERVLEIVAADDASKARSRERFKFYRDRGYDIKTHNL